MSDYIDAREPFRRVKVVATPTHKFSVGAHVAFNPGHSGERGYFRVERHLPDGGHGLQYRIRSERDGQERVVIETTLERAR
jgi:hypothetical protein